MEQLGEESAPWKAVGRGGLLREAGNEKRLSAPSSAGVSVTCLWNLEMFNGGELVERCVPAPGPCPAAELPTGVSQVPGSCAGLTHAAAVTTSSPADLLPRDTGMAMASPAPVLPLLAFGVFQDWEFPIMSERMQRAGRQRWFLTQCVSWLVLPFLQPVSPGLAMLVSESCVCLRVGLPWGCLCCTLLPPP